MVRREQEEAELEMGVVSGEVVRNETSTVGSGSGVWTGEEHNSQEFFEVGRAEGKEGKI